MTTEQSSVSSTPRDQVDLDSKDAQALLESAFNEAQGSKAKPATVVESTPAPTEHKDTTTSAPAPTEEDRRVAEALAKVEDTSHKDVSSPAGDTSTPADNASTNEYSGPEWAKDLPEQARAKILEMVERDSFRDKQFKMEASRQRGLQQKLYNAREQAKALRAKLQEQAQEAAGRSDAAKNIAEWNQLIEADPALAKAIERFQEAREETLRNEFRAQVDATVDPLYQHTEHSYVDYQMQVLQAEVPNYREVVNSPVYQYWLENEAAPGLRELAYNSTEASDALTVLRVYAGEAQNTYGRMVGLGYLPAPQQQQQVVDQQQQTVQQQAPQQPNRADKVAQSRQQRVQAAPVVAHAPNPIGASPGTDQLRGKPGDYIDLDNDAVQALFAAEFDKVRGRYKK